MEVQEPMPTNPVETAKIIAELNTQIKSLKYQLVLAQFQGASLPVPTDPVLDSGLRRTNYRGFLARLHQYLYTTCYKRYELTDVDEIMNALNAQISLMGQYCEDPSNKDKYADLVTGHRNLWNMLVLGRSTICATLGDAAAQLGAYVNQGEDDSPV